MLFRSESVRERNISTLFSTMTFVILGHLLTSLYTREFLTLEWLKTLTGLQNKAANAQLPESIAIWPILTGSGLSPHTATFISALLIITLSLLLLIISIRRPRIDNRMTSLLVPSLGFFFHFYDLAPTIVFIIFAYVVKNRQDIISLIIGIFIIPENFTDTTSLILLTTSICYSQILCTPRKVKAVLARTLGSFLAWIVYATVVLLLENCYGRHTVAMTVTIILLLFLNLKDAKSQIRNSAKSRIEN